MRIRQGRSVSGSLPGGLEPEFEAPHFAKSDFDSGRAPEDGQIISDRSYDQIKRDMVRA
jgi:hypothetical protein